MTTPRKTTTTPAATPRKAAAKAPAAPAVPAEGAAVEDNTPELAAQAEAEARAEVAVTGTGAVSPFNSDYPVVATPAQALRSLLAAIGFAPDSFKRIEISASGIIRIVGADNSLRSRRVDLSELFKDGEA